MRLSSSPSFWLGREQCDDADTDSAADHLLTLLFAVDERMGFPTAMRLPAAARGE